MVRHPAMWAPSFFPAKSKDFDPGHCQIATRAVTDVRPLLVTVQRSLLALSAPWRALGFEKQSHGRSQVLLQECQASDQQKERQLNETHGLLELMKTAEASLKTSAQECPGLSLHHFLCACPRNHERNLTPKVA